MSYRRNKSVHEKHASSFQGVYKPIKSDLTCTLTTLEGAKKRRYRTKYIVPYYLHVKKKYTHPHRLSG